MVPAVIEPYLIGGQRRYNRDEVARLSGVAPELAHALWVALGFAADPDDNAKEFTDTDVAALRSFRELEFATATDVVVQVTATRTLGQAMARLAEWQADLLMDDIKTNLSRSDSSSDRAVFAATEKTITALARLQDYAWRRHLAAALARMTENDPSAAGPGTTTRSLLVGFADMVSYTRMTRHLEADELAQMLNTFESATTEVITSGGAWVIKNVGDEVMFAADSPIRGAVVGLAIQHNMADTAVESIERGRERLLPALRVGLAYGNVLQRFGDMYGTVVNTAARLTGLARPGTVLVDDRVAESISNDSRFELRSLRSVQVRGFSRLHSHVLRYATPQ